MIRIFPRWVTCLVTAASLGTGSVLAAPLVIHEWGTFTSLQDEKGQAIGGVNTDDEALPAFVHRLSYPMLLRPTELPSGFSKGFPTCRPDITMRLETPVLYFHPSAASTVEDVSVSATFHGGWLSEFYPLAETIPAQADPSLLAPISANTTGSLTWSHLSVGGTGQGPETSYHVWTSPRQVEAAGVKTTNGETEQFLFYRGVAHLDAPIAVTQDFAHSELVLHSQCAAGVTHQSPLPVKSLWLVDIDKNGQLAFRVVPAVSLEGNGQPLERITSRFKAEDHGTVNREKLKQSLQAALAKEGLFDDEAQALLNTWEASYFKSAGLRLFFLVPREWTEFYLPLKVSQPAEITRVMVGRIELVSPEQRLILHELTQVSTDQIKTESLMFETNLAARFQTYSPDLDQLFTGRESLKSVGVAVPHSLQLYIDLGRFRNALVLDQNRREPSPALDALIQSYRLPGFQRPRPTPSLTTQKD